MSKKMMGLFLGGILCLPLFMFTEDLPKSAIEGVQDVYYGHISFTEVKHDGRDPVVIRDGEPDKEVAVLNLPLTAGDTIITPEGRRCEIQFDTGTILRLDVNTELRLETLLANSLSSLQKMTNLMLYRGRVYVMYKRYMSREVFQVKTPKTAVKLDHNSVAMIHARDDSATDVRVLEGKVYVLFGPEDVLDFTTAKVKKEQQLTITAENHLVTNDYQKDADFMSWNVELNENFVETHEGKTYIPLPIQRYPKAVFYFAQKYANLHGEWIYDRMYGYVWRPFFNDSYPDGSWQPYYYGYWRRLDGELFWVPAEPWGWVPYHLGVWQWDKERGWLWIPGDAFAPAWAVWDFYFGYYTWRPWLIWDWSWYGQRGYYGIALLLYQRLFLSYWYSWGNYTHGWGSITSFVPPKYLSTVTKDQLQKPANPPYKIPDKMRNAGKLTQKALEQGNKRALESIRAVPSQMFFVEGRHLNSQDISKRALRAKDITQPVKSWNGDLKPLSDPYTAAVQAHWDAEGAAALRQYMFRDQEGSTRHTPDHFNARETSEKAGSGRYFIREEGSADPVTSVSENSFSGINNPRTFGSRGSSMRVRDWNPDIKYARMAGVSIVYSSKNNEIICPELNRSSDKSANFRSGIRRGSGSSSSVSRGLSNFISSSGGSSGGSGLSGSSSQGSIGASGRGFASSGGGTRGGSGSKK
ncbi:MAG: FecR domain-containing protein [Candidatus Aminicenantes bacterium]|nr:FecR domain-containing protein [Candidatus Aminicenantes bacterium]